MRHFLVDLRVEKPVDFVELWVAADVLDIDIDVWIARYVDR